MSGDWREITVAALGSGGDGIAEIDGGRVYVPYSAPGDRVRIRVTGKTVAVGERLADGPGRCAPPCPHFGRCGGCAVQHVTEPLYQDWKRGLLVRALAQRGLDCPVDDLVCVPPGTRRRARLAAVNAGGRLILGYRARGSHRIVDIEACPLLAPEIPTLLPALRDMLAGELAPRDKLEISVSSLAGALDVSVDTSREPDLERRKALADFAVSADLARLVWGGEILVRRRPVTLDAGGLRIELPPGAFLQPTAFGEEFLRAAVARILDGATRLADLYAGCGALSAGLALSGDAALHAYEQHEASCEALAAAVRGAGLGARIDATSRDLSRQPLAGKELRRLDGVILDPPRTGAAAQAAALAESAVPRIAYVSCSPASFARDARALVDGGYRLESVTPLDQFPWSAHLELVAAFAR